MNDTCFETEIPFDSYIFLSVDFVTLLQARGKS